MIVASNAIMIINVAAAVVTILAGLTAAFMWFSRQVIKAAAEAMKRIEGQVTPNGGNTNSLGDRVQRIEYALEDLREELKRHQ